MTTKKPTTTSSKGTTTNAEKTEQKTLAVQPKSPLQKSYHDATDGTKVIQDDIYLEPHAEQLRTRYNKYKAMKASIEAAEGSLAKFAEGYKKFGFNRGDCLGRQGIWLREWIPTAQRVTLFGEFNGWNRDNHVLNKDEYGVWSIFLADGANNQPAIRHATKIKLCVHTQDGKIVERIPAWIRVVWQEHKNPFYDAVYWNPPQPYVWKYQTPTIPKDLRIYECHVGMSSHEPKCSTYIEFKDNVLPEIVDAGYNAIQIMAVMEHAYYASFGYQVTNFFACSSRFGTPEELKEMIDKAHDMGLVVLLDLVHSHASKNVDDGINHYDGTDHCFFHGGIKGEHPVWDSRLFNYSLYEVQRFLLSNARFYIDEYHFDGFRFDGVTSMIYEHHGVKHDFVDGYTEYFDTTLTNEDAIIYLTLCNEMVHSLGRPVITIAEDVSGFATIAKPVASGGVGFDYRLHMAVPDKWIKLLKLVKDEAWSMGDIVYELTNRRHLEPTIAYAESHDQALVGDKTIAFWLMDKEMYFHMSVLEQVHPVIARGMALHKIIRLLTSTLAGEGYLNFMGNEFGHPEWIDFPREGNNDSFDHARRRWDLKKDKLLRYHHLFNFDKAMNTAEEKLKWLCAPQAYIIQQLNEEKIIAFERGGLLCVFNFHPTDSYTDYSVGVSRPGKYRLVLNSDEKDFGGFGNIANSSGYFSSPHKKTHEGDFPQALKIYLPSRVGLIFALDDK